MNWIQLNIKSNLSMVHPFVLLNLNKQRIRLINQESLSIHYQYDNKI